MNKRKVAFRASHGLTIKAATEKALNSLTPAERRLIDTSTHGKRWVLGRGTWKELTMILRSANTAK